jgi:hypothetical protein
VTPLVTVATRMWLTQSLSESHKDIIDGR